MSAHKIGVPSRRRLVIAGLASVGLTAVVALLAVVFLHFSAPTAHASVSGCVPTTTPACTFKSNDAAAEFDSVSSDGCIMTQAIVRPFASLTRPAQTTSQSVVMFISKFNACTGVQLELASNTDPITFAQDFTGTIQFGPGLLSAAAVNGTAPMFDVFTGTQLFTSTINVTWEGFGPTTTFIGDSHSHSPGLIVYTHFTGTSRAAKASGTFTDETGSNLATTPTLNAGLDNARSGIVLITTP